MDYSIKDSGKKVEFATGANRDIQENKGRFDLLPCGAIAALAVHFEKGCNKYGDRNWEKGVPISRYTSSALRHLFQFLEGKDDENHLIASLWNIAAAYQTLLWVRDKKLPAELYDLPEKVDMFATGEVNMSPAEIEMLTAGTDNFLVYAPVIG